jgi:glycosyltransferase involved in cell wall biosynthesis
VKVCLVIPVFNERDQIESSVNLLFRNASRPAAFDLELVVADNGSTDGTTKIAERLASSVPNVKHEYSLEKGRGRALRQAWLNNEAEVLAYMDVDLSTDLSFFSGLIEPLLRGEADVATGSRLLRPEWTKRGWKREFISRCYNWLLRAAFAGNEELTLANKIANSRPCGLSFSDAQCGFKAITKKAANELLPMVEDNEWFFDTELLLLADFLGYRIHDLPVRWTDDSDSRVKIVPTIIKDLKGIVRMKRRLGNMERAARMSEQEFGKTISFSMEDH